MATIGPYTGLTFRATIDIPDLFMTLGGTVFGWGPVDGFPQPPEKFDFTIGELSADGNWYKAGTNAMVNKDRLNEYIELGYLVRVSKDGDGFEERVSRLETID